MLYGLKPPPVRGKLFYLTWVFCLFNVLIPLTWFLKILTLFMSEVEKGERNNEKKKTRIIAERLRISLKNERIFISLYHSSSA